MIETGNLSDFNNARLRDISLCNDTEIVAILSENITQFPNIYSLLTETTQFYTENFSDLQKYIKREKRLIVFETPSRVSMTHEYTIEGAGNIPQGFHFLFNTRERLSWLKIFLEDKRVSIASKTKVVSLLINKLGAELDFFAKLLNSSKENVALRLYEASDGKPCFVEFNQKEYIHLYNNKYYNTEKYLYENTFNYNDIFNISIFISLLTIIFSLYTKLKSKIKHKNSNFLFMNGGEKYVRKR